MHRPERPELAIVEQRPRDAHDPVQHRRGRRVQFVEAGVDHGLDLCEGRLSQNVTTPSTRRVKEDAEPHEVHAPQRVRLAQDVETDVAHGLQRRQLVYERRGPEPERFKVRRRVGAEDLHRAHVESPRFPERHAN